LRVWERRHLTRLMRVGMNRAGLWLELPAAYKSAAVKAVAGLRGQKRLAGGADDPMRQF
jgi:hypothetical protein